VGSERQFQSLPLPTYPYCQRAGLALHVHFELSIPPMGTFPKEEIQEEKLCACEGLFRAALWVGG
jgi:hypothetical protein